MCNGGIPSSQQRLHVAQGPGNHPVTQRHDQTALLGQRHEFARRQQAALTVAPAHQRFEADDLPVRKVQAWLVVQFQLVAAQRPAQLAFQVGHGCGHCG